MKLIYHLSSEARQRIFIESGRDPGQAQAIEVDPAELSKEQRALLVAHDPTLGERVLLTYPDWTGFTTTSTTLALSAPATDAGAERAGHRRRRADRGVARCAGDRAGARRRGRGQEDRG